MNDDRTTKRVDGGGPKIPMAWIILCGGVIETLSGLEERNGEGTRQRPPQASLPPLRVMRAELGNGSGAIGAAAARLGAPGEGDVG